MSKKDLTTLRSLLSDMNDMGARPMSTNDSLKLYEAAVARVTTARAKIVEISDQHRRYVKRKNAQGASDTRFYLNKWRGKLREALRDVKMYRSLLKGSVGRNRGN